MGSQFDASTESTPFKVLVLGGCYGGLSAALNLLDLSEGRAARQGNGAVPGHDGKIPVDITIVDERDGYCMSKCLTTSVPPHSGNDFKSKLWPTSTDLVENLLYNVSKKSPLKSMTKSLKLPISQ